MRSRERDGRPVGVVDDMIRQSLARQRSAAPTKQRAWTRSEEEETKEGGDHARGEAGNTRRRKKRGSGSRKQSEVRVAPPHLHLMYREEDVDEPSHEREDEERDAPDA